MNEKRDNELNDLYEYIESKEILHLTTGSVKLKLLPHQKQLLKDIHENDKLLIIKGRQIGASTLLAGYYGWRYQRDKIVSVIKSTNHECVKYLYKRIKEFNSDIPKLITDAAGIRADLYIYDEYNFNKNYLDILDSCNLSGKHIVTGTVDKSEKLHKLYHKLLENKDPFNVVWYPVSRCYGLWNKKRIKSLRCNFGDIDWDREMECQW